MANQREKVPTAWNRKVLDILLRMFPSQYRPTLLHPYSDPELAANHNLVCDRVIVRLRPGDEE